MQTITFLLLLNLALYLMYAIKYITEYFLTEEESNPGYAFKKILSIRPRSVFECARLARKVVPKGYDIFPFVVACQQNNKRLVMAKNLL
jgi:hypothetical protein